jgi:hypothetical protein
MERWEEEIVELRTLEKIADGQAKVDAALVAQLVFALYFSEEAANKLQSLTSKIADTSIREQVHGAFTDSLRARLAVVRAADAAGVAVQIGLKDAIKLLRTDLENHSQH